NLIWREKRSILIHHAETVGVTVCAEARDELFFFHPAEELGQLLFRRFWGMAAEVHIAPIMKHSHFAAGFLQKGIEIPAARPVKNIHPDFEFGFFEGADINEFFESRKIGWLGVKRLNRALIRPSATFSPEGRRPSPV